MLPWLMMGAGALLSASQANAQRKAQQQANQQNAEISAAQTRYSPWTGINPQGFKMEANPNNTAAAALQGGVAGAAQGMKFGEYFKKDAMTDGAQEGIPGTQNNSPWGQMKKQSLYGQKFVTPEFIGE